MVFAPFSLPTLDPAQQLQQGAKFRNQMSTRRRVRDFSSQPFPVELIEHTIATAANAPSCTNQQPWRFVVV